MTRPYHTTAAFVPLRKKAALVRSAKRRRNGVRAAARSGKRHARRGRSPWRKAAPVSHRRRRMADFSAAHTQELNLPDTGEIRDSRTDQAEESAYAKGFDAGYKAGAATGAEEEMASLLPPYTILPGVSAKEVMEAGLQRFLPRLQPLLKPEEVHVRLEQSLALKKPLSVVRLGDGELLALAHDTVLPLAHAKAAGPFLTRAGITLPDYEARDRLAEAVRGADIIGIPASRLPTYQGLLFPVLRYYGIGHDPYRFTISTINYALHEHKLLQPLLRNRQVLVIGNKAEPLAEVLSASGVHITGTVAPVNGFRDVPGALAATAQHTFDIALVASGIPAVVICQTIAAELGKVALDFGHLADKLISGELTYDDDAS